MRRAGPVILVITILFLAVGCSAAQATDEPTPTPVPTAIKPTFTVQRSESFSIETLSNRVRAVGCPTASTRSLSKF